MTKSAANIALAVITLRFLFFISTLVLLTSCERYFSFKGKVIDRSIDQGLDKIEIFFILKSHDTMRLYSSRQIYDTFSHEKRIALRRQGKKDDYDGNDEIGFYRLSPDLIDTAGFFYFQTQLVSCSPKCPTGKLIFRKKGFKPLTVPIDKMRNDSMLIYLERLTNDK